MITMDDDDIIDKLVDIDEADWVETTSWEADFINSVAFSWVPPLTDRQRKSAKEIIDKYWDEV